MTGESQVKLLNQKAKERNGLTSAVKGQTHGLVSSVVMNSTTGTRMMHGRAAGAGAEMGGEERRKMIGRIGRIGGSDML